MRRPASEQPWIEEESRRRTIALRDLGVDLHGDLADIGSPLDAWDSTEHVEQPAEEQLLAAALRLVEASNNVERGAPSAP